MILRETVSMPIEAMGKKQAIRVLIQQTQEPWERARSEQASDGLYWLLMAIAFGWGLGLGLVL